MTRRHVPTLSDFDRVRPVPTFRQLCVMVHCVFDVVGNDASPLDVGDELKWAIARAGLGYPSPDRMTDAIAAVACARAKGYRTPVRGTRLYAEEGEAIRLRAARDVRR